MRRLLGSLWRRTRDLGFLALVADHFWHGLSGWVTLAAGIGFAGIMTAVMASAAATASKAANTEQRVNDLVTTVGDTNASVDQVSKGVFPNVSGGTVTLVGGGVTLHCGALSQLDTETQTAFLSGLSLLPHQTTANATSFSNANFTGLANAVNNLQANLQSRNYEA